MARKAGRPKGSPNKVPANIRRMVLEALDKEGGVQYLQRQANENPTAFMGLLSKILPSQIQAEVTHTHKVLEVNMIGLEMPKAIESKPQAITLDMENIEAEKITA